MKLHIKLCITFSLIIFAMQSLNATIYYHYEKENFERSAVENLTAMGEKMMNQFEEYVRVMDYTLENLISNVEFMNSMSVLSNSQAPDQITVRDSQSTMTGVLYRDPLNKNFYRVNAFNRAGDFFTSRFDNRDTVNALSYDIEKIIKDIPWLDDADGTPFRRMLVPPYIDPWTTSEPVYVFSAARSVLWLGKPIGYLEVQADAGVLAEIFSPEGLTGVDIQAVMDGKTLYRTREIMKIGDLSNKSNAPIRLSGNGAEELVLVFHDEMLGLSLAISQDTAAWQASMNRIGIRLILISVILVIASTLIVTLLSLGLTRSIRQLERKIGMVDIRDTTIISSDAPATGTGDEIHQLERAFDTLLNKLNRSMRAEIRQRELHNQARFIALQAQINPHFIYNTLNMIASRSMEGGDLEIARICDRFAAMLRYSIDVRERTATVREELEHARNYLALLKARYEDRLEYHISVPDEMMGYLLPRVCLQPLIENSILHGYRSRVRTMRVSISGEILADGYVLRIVDNGDGFNEEVLEILRDAVERLGRGPIENPFGGPENAGLGMINTFERMYAYSSNVPLIELSNEHGAVIRLFFQYAKEN